MPSFGVDEEREWLCYERRGAQAVVLTGHPGIGECVCLYLQDTLLIVDEGCLCYVGAVPKRKPLYFCRRWHLQNGPRTFT